MNVYTTDSIRNVVFLGHGGVGKTTMAEQMALTSGAITRAGKVTDKNTISDYDPEEQKRGFSLNASVVPIEWKSSGKTHKINILDTPGFFDFVGEVDQCLRAADAAIIVVSAKSGVEVGTELAWEKCEDAKLPRIIFVNNMDDPEADLQKVLSELTEKFGTGIAPFQVPFKENGKFAGFVNVPKMAGRRFVGDRVEDCPIPAGMEDDIEPVREAIMEAAASTSDELMEKYFEEGELSEDEILDALQVGIKDGTVVPVMCGSAVSGMGIGVLMSSICSYLPNPAQANQAVETADGGELTLTEDGSTVALVFKTSVDPFFGKISYMKIMSGTLKGGATLYNAATETEVRTGKCFVLRGKEQIEVPELKAGDIGAMTKLNDIKTGDTLSTKDAPVVLPVVTYDPSQMCMAVQPKQKGDDDKMNAGLSKIMEEDPTIRIVNDPEMKQELIYGKGQQHLEVTIAKLKNKFKTEVELVEPKVSYRETIRGRYEIRSKYKKQSGGHGQYGDVNIVFEPSGDQSKPYVFEEQVFGGSVPKNYFPAVEKGIQESVVEGVLAGYPMVGLKATLTDGSYHPVDSSEMAFKTATSMAYKDGVPKAKPVILEPIANVKVFVPESYMGDIMGDMNKRRGRVLGMEHQGKKQMIECEVPMSEMFTYTADLRSMTQGRGTYTAEFVRYEETTPDVQAKIIEEANKAKA
ncbi:MAG: elongation factor G [Lachnospiraceae bacterium]|nr:elongation factor G [Lachnospiraceae bacterium]